MGYHYILRVISWGLFQVGFLAIKFNIGSGMWKIYIEAYMEDLDLF